ncbi:transcriptional repressor [Candidatus Uhrbacteria bacterium]|nr:transcriptional repressor [Candidatus Uhrbacteria bacterium]
MQHACHIDRLIKNAGLRCTQDRHDLLEVFLQDRAWSASQLASHVPDKQLSTIYRNLTKLTEAGLIRSIHSHTTEEYFELISKEHHDHEACPTCHKVSCIPCPIVRMRTPHMLEIQHICPTCV